jgi:hypothetical protein
LRIVGVALLIAGCGLLGGIAVASSGLFMTVFAVFGLVLLGFGTVFVLARTWIQRNAAARAVYVVTNRRAIVREHRRDIRAYDIAKLQSMRRKDSARLKGAGDLIFETEKIHVGGQAAPPLTAPTRGPRVSTIQRERGFLMLENVKSVEKLIRETLVDRGIDKVLAD